MKYNSASILNQLESNKYFDKKLMPEKQGVYFVCTIKRKKEVVEYIGSTKNLRVRLLVNSHVFNQLLMSGEKPFIRFAKIGKEFRKIECDMIYHHMPNANRNNQSMEGTRKRGQIFYRNYLKEQRQIRKKQSV